MPVTVVVPTVTTLIAPSTGSRRTKRSVTFTVGLAASARRELGPIIGQLRRTGRVLCYSLDTLTS
jgi:hypothetical protein